MLKTILLAATATLAFAPHELPDMAIGSPVPQPELRMKDVSGREVSLKEAARENGLLVPQQGIARDPKGQTTALVVGKAVAAQRHRDRALRQQPAQ